MDLPTTLLVLVVSLLVLRFIHIPPHLKLGSAILLIGVVVFSLLSALNAALATLSATPLPLLLGACLVLVAVLALGFFLGRGGLLGGDSFGPFD